MHQVIKNIHKKRIVNVKGVPGIGKTTLIKAVAHYLDDLKGCGHHLEEHARENFFSILKGMVSKLRESKDEEEIKVILNSLKWKYLARDHLSLYHLDLFKVLHQGDGKNDHKLKRSWGRPLKQEIVSQEKDKKLSKEVIDLFE
jgi:tRNA A37 threonylcarbamoyladenosine biosynthesis protein TsaE